MRHIPEFKPLKDEQLHQKMCRFGATGIVHAWLLEQFLDSTVANSTVDRIFEEHTSAAIEEAAQHFPITAIKRVLSTYLQELTTLQRGQLADLLQHEMGLERQVDVFAEDEHVVVAMAQEDALLLRRHYDPLSEFPSAAQASHFDDRVAAMF